MLPFRWELIDAYYYVPHFGPLRQRNGDSEAPMEPAVVRERMLAALDAHDEGHLVLLFHPFLLSAAPDALAVVSDVLARAAEFRCLRCARHAEREPPARRHELARRRGIAPRRQLRCARHRHVRWAAYRR